MTEEPTVLRDAFGGDYAPHAPAISPEHEQWARALCEAWGGKPDKLIGFPEQPAWRSFVGYAAVSIRAAEIVRSRP